MATDVPFWRKSTGAEQRMASLVHFLSVDWFQVRTFYLGQSESEQFTSQDRDLIEAQDLDVEQRSSDQPPQQLANKFGWYAQAAKHQFAQWARKTDVRSDDDEGATSVTLETPTLADYRWPWAVSAFGESVDDFQPGSIIIQYVKLSYLLDALSDQQRNNIKTLIDTHDVLHIRAQQFREHGFQHWIELTRDEEANELKKFDSIIAIQDEEAELFRQMAPDCNTIVCGHSVDHTTSPLPTPNPAATTDIDEPSRPKLTIGYLGSANASNVHAVESFLNNVWPELLAQQSEVQFNLVIAGGICQWLVQSELFESIEADNVDLIGSIAFLPTFYNRVDVVINPVQFGTGLKIKNCEAIAFGKPVLTTTEGNIGFAEAVSTATIVCDSPEEFQKQLMELACNRQELTRLQEAATKLSQAGFSDLDVYSVLKQTLLQLK